MYFSSAVLRSLGLCPGRLVVVPASQWLWEGVFLCGLLCQSVIRISCYQNYSRNTRPALLSTLLPVSYTPLCARGRQCALSCRRRGRVLGRYRLAQCDGGSAPCAGGALFCFHSCAQARPHCACQTRTFARGTPFHRARIHTPPTSKTANRVTRVYGFMVHARVTQ